MKRMNQAAAVGLLLGCVSLLSFAAEEGGGGGGAAAADKPKAVVSDVSVRTLEETTYFYTSVQTTYARIVEAVGQVVPKLEKAVGEGKVRVTGSYVFVYHGATADPNKEFTLEIGTTVAEDTKPQGEFKVRKLPAFQCASVLFQGPVQQMMVPYGKLLPQVQQAGHEMTGESREYYMYWEGEDSANNVVMIGVGIKPKQQ